MPRLDVRPTTRRLDGHPTPRPPPQPYVFDSLVHRPRREPGLEPVLSPRPLALEHPSDLEAREGVRPQPRIGIEQELEQAARAQRVDAAGLCEEDGGRAGEFVERDAAAVL